MKIKLFGIDIKIHWTWWIFFLLLTGGSILRLDLNSFISNALLSVLLMGTIVMHELAHALTARRYGVVTNYIGLYIFGGVAWIQSSKSLKLNEEFWIAFAGPLSNLAVFPFLALLYKLIGFEIFLWAASVNLVIGVFNLIPAYPMDGGRILRTLLEMFGAQKVMAIMITQNLAIFFGLLLIFGGIYIGAVGMAIIGLMIIAATWSEKMGNGF